MAPTKSTSVKDNKEKVVKKRSTFKNKSAFVTNQSHRFVSLHHLKTELDLGLVRFDLEEKKPKEGKVWKNSYIGAKVYKNLSKEETTNNVNALPFSICVPDFMEEHLHHDISEKPNKTFLHLGKIENPTDEEKEEITAYAAITSHLKLALGRLNNDYLLAEVAIWDINGHVSGTTPYGMTEEEFAVFVDSEGLFQYTISLTVSQTTKDGQPVQKIYMNIPFNKKKFQPMDEEDVVVKTGRRAKRTVETSSEEEEHIVKEVKVEE
jgi:hypothetical protein